jgi:4a-hydroxytetrahydrobiopterin dehydratase
MKYLKTYKLFESQNLDSLANQFLDEYSHQYDLRLGKPFDKEKANCSWFTKEFYNWAKSKSIDVKIVYFDSDVEAHIVPMVDGQTIDFSVKQFTKNPDDDYIILAPEYYSKWGYSEYEILDEFPDWTTVMSASKSKWSEIDNKLQREFEFDDFQQALQFINEIAVICESENHHPEINWVYNKIILKLSTHDAGDVITEKDIKLAELIDEVA